jgi:hypothetical protein
LFVLDLISLAVDLAAVDLAIQGHGLSDTTVVLSVATLLVFMFGLLCDQVSSLRRELHE